MIARLWGPGRGRWLLNGRVEIRLLLVQGFAMPLTVDQIVQQTKEWPEDFVTELIDKIMLAKFGGIEPAVEAAWRTEARRRVDEIRSGREPGVDGEEVMAKARKLIGR
jgi:hypothetical protein